MRDVRERRTLVPALALHTAAVLDELSHLENMLVLAVCALEQAGAPIVERLLIPDVRFDILAYPDANAREDFRFTGAELLRISSVMQVPNVFISGAGDRLLGVEALAMLCYRLSYPGKLSRIRKLFGRSDPACSRIITDLYCFLDEKWGDILYFNDRVFIERHSAYTRAIANTTDGVIRSISMFIDGTKAFICRPGKRAEGYSVVQGALNAIPVNPRENLQKVCYSGHKRRDCLNYQGVCTPDGRRHDSTMLSESKLLSYLTGHPVISTLGALIYGDPAYGISDILCSPFRNVHVSSTEQQFNTIMSKSRVSVEWLFGIIKCKWAFLDWNKKHKILLTPVARMVRVAVLLTNAATCIYGGSQISSYFDCHPPTLEEYFRQPHHPLAA